MTFLRMKRCFTGGAQSVSRMQGCLLQRRRFAEPLRSRHIKQPETGKESKIKLIGSPMIASANHELNEVSSRKWKACLENRSFHYEGTYKHFPPTMWIKMFGLMILGRMCGQGGLHYIMMQLCIQQHVNLSQRMLMLLNDVENNPGPISY
ncbi:uncharacterized protein LOC127834285 isoform X3 [Dreissena polymorpha]|uniref:uncharacterized protein LOC127834285 isoform X3 n=1 Tax=Dreissena polymorpha TaxID=45954 RepID=UPI002263DE0F|nr:uncharacterized protein LOC127834285 isoform X3 [Dreissena polymorpha]